MESRFQPMQTCSRAALRNPTVQLLHRSNADCWQVGQNRKSRNRRSPRTENARWKTSEIKIIQEKDRNNAAVDTFIVFTSAFCMLQLHSPLQLADGPTTSKNSPQTGCTTYRSCLQPASTEPCSAHKKVVKWPGLKLYVGLLIICHSPIVILSYIRECSPMWLVFVFHIQRSQLRWFNHVVLWLWCD